MTLYSLGSNEISKPTYLLDINISELINDNGLDTINNQDTEKTS